LGVKTKLGIIKRFKIRFKIIYLNDDLIDYVIEDIFGIISGAVIGNRRWGLTEDRRHIRAAYKAGIIVVMF
jgi:hypothetical protein